MFEVRSQCEPMPYMYAALYSLPTVCFRLHLHLPRGLHGMIVVYCYSVWWSEETHSERWGAGEGPTWYSQDLHLFLPLPFAQLLLRPSSWTWSAHACVPKQAHAVVAFAKSSIWTPRGMGEGAFFSLNTVSSHRLLSLPQWPADCELGFNLRTPGFFLCLPSEKSPACEVLWDPWMKEIHFKKWSVFFCFPFKECQEMSETELSGLGPLVT